MSNETYTVRETCYSNRLWNVCMFLSRKWKNEDDGGKVNSDIDEDLNWTRLLLT